MKEKEEEVTTDAVADLLRGSCGMRPPSSMKAYRLGRKRDNGDRLIKVCLDSEEKKWEVLKRINSTKPSGVFSNLDLTQEERELQFKLRERARTLKEENKGTLYRIKNWTVQKHKGESLWESVV